MEARVGGDEHEAGDLRVPVQLLGLRQARVLKEELRRELGVGGRGGALGQRALLLGVALQGEVPHRELGGE